MESSCYLSGASTASSLSLPRGGSGGVDGGGGGGGRRSPPRTEGAVTPRKTPRNIRKAASGGGSHSGDVADLRKRYMYDDSNGNAVSIRAKEQTATTPRNRKTRGEQATTAPGGGDGEGGTSAKHGGKEATRSKATTKTRKSREIVAASCDADDGYDEDEVLTAAVTLLSSTTTVPNSPVSPPPPPVAIDTEVLRARYDRELMAILQEEQAAESAREKAWAAAKDRAKAAQARATHGGASTSKRRRGGRDKRPRPAAGVKASPVTGFGGGSDLQRSREAEAAVAAREEAQLKRELARERREASERVMRVSEEYEKALKKLATGDKAVRSSNESPAG